MTAALHRPVLEEPAPEPPVGLFGKLPSHGDFVRRRVSDAFVAVWDPWLQAVVTASRDTLGERWLEVFLTSPVWRFACAPGACGPDGVVGLLVPSVDRVGRYFPFTVVTVLPQGVGPLAAMRDTAGFLDLAERLILETLEARTVDVDRFDRELCALAAAHRVARPAATLDATAARWIADEGSGRAWHLPVAAPAQVAAIGAQLLDTRLSTLYAPLSVWWTEGSEAVEPSTLLVAGLPAPEACTALLDGGWARPCWTAVPVAVADPSASADDSDTLAHAARTPRFRSAAATDVGRVRQVNQDAYLERADAGIWVVADGLGGLSEGDAASRMVCDAVVDLPPVPDLDALVAEARARLAGVNAHLYERSVRPDAPVRSCSTVVALFTRGASFGVLWAGDSRLYRWRDGELAQVTRDHSLAGATAGAAGRELHAVTRAVGGEGELALDLLTGHVRPGDRYLLCSDGLTRTVPDSRIAELLATRDLRAAVDALLQATLAAGAPDNVTALLVETVADDE